MDKKVRVYAHRGASSAAPENTMAAFKKAVEAGSHGIELDVQMTSDGELIVCHDEYVNRTTNGKGLIKDMTAEQIRKLDAGSWFNKSYEEERIPYLSEVLKLVKDSGIYVNIELKSGIILYPEIEEKTMEMVKLYDLMDKTIISSFNHYSVNKVKTLYPKVKTGILYMAGLYEPWEYMKNVGCECAHPYYMSLKPEIVEGLKSRGYIINAFTVDDEQHAKQLAALGVDGIITNCPDKILTVV